MWSDAGVYAERKVILRLICNGKLIYSVDIEQSRPSVGTVFGGSRMTRPH